MNLGDVMDRVYEISNEKKEEAKKILETDPYAEDSFARVGYKIRDGKSLEEDPEKTYLYISASEDFIKKADEKLKDVADVVEGEKAKRVVEKIQKEEESVGSGIAKFFG